jgi:acetoin utilization protein AcuC
VSGEVGVAFNPSGGFHHAGPERAGGFCYINDLVIACLLLAEEGRRVVYLDVDVHHGDGVQNAFYARSDVMTISFHESGKTLFPGGGFEDEIGTGEGRGFNVNVGLPVRIHDEPYLRAFRALAVPLIGAYDPDVIVLVLGMDGLSGDPLAHLSLTNNAYAEVVSLVMGFGKPILATGGGGYNPRNTARGWALAWGILCGEEDAGGADHALGGVMLESTDWQGGLRDRTLVPDPEQANAVNSALNATIEAVEAGVFPLHGL